MNRMLLPKAGPRIFWWLAAAVFVGLALVVWIRPAIVVGCASFFNTEHFFQTAELTEVQVCLDTGVDLKAQDERGRTPLHWAAWGNDNPAVIKVLLDAGADLEARNEYGHTPLHWAAGFNGNPAIIEILLGAGADLNAQNEGGWV